MPTGFLLRASITPLEFLRLPLLLERQLQYRLMLHHLSLE
jgi:hypothetical protein